MSVIKPGQDGNDGSAVPLPDKENFQPENRSEKPTETKVTEFVEVDRTAYILIGLVVLYFYFLKRS